MFLGVQKSGQGGKEREEEYDVGGFFVGEQVPPELPNAGHSLSWTEAPQEPDYDDDDDDDDNDYEGRSPSES